MAQLSRPFQIALAAVVLLAGVWLFAFQGHSSTTAGSAASPAVSASTPATSTSPAAANATGSASTTAAKPAPTHATSPGSGSSLGPFSHAIHQAQHAAAITQQHEHQVEARAAQDANAPAPSTTSSASSTAPSTTAKAPATTKPSSTSSAAKADTKTQAKAPTSSTHTGASSSSAASALAKPSGQTAVEADLAKGNVVVLLFWNPAGTDDVVAHKAVQTVSHTQKHVSVLQAPASQIASFGSITRGVQISQTPTIMVINKSGQTLVLTGPEDAFSIAQAIAEARS
jgi:hypothetical protein